ncbi:MAG: mediator of RNA polymerase II transcription subunit 13 [Vezdaea aestivalis]|nr:MAG: mediator of RNA polymerase II transcription subunit 13 [Vezdaea aestivalis]
MTSNKTPTDGISWLLGPEHGGRRDPLAFAQEWYLGRTERDKLNTAKKKELEDKKLREEVHRQELADGSYTNDTSAHHRLGTAGDNQSVAGVYPTPPDGINASGLRGPASVDATGSTPGAVIHTSTSLSQGDSQQDHNKHHDNEFELEGGLFEGTGDGLLFDENDITEEDFSFFDKPGFDDIDDAMEGIDTTVGGQDDQSMKDASELLEPVIEKIVKLPQVKSEEADDSHQQQTYKMEVEEDEEVQLLSISQTVSSPFTPNNILRRLLPGSQTPEITVKIEAVATKENDILHLRGKGSTFDDNFNAIALNRALQTFDEKYRESGRFFSPVVDNAQTIAFQESSRQSTLSSIPKLGMNKKRNHTHTISQDLALVQHAEEQKKHSTLTQLPRRGTDHSDSSSFSSDDDESDDDTSYSMSEELPFLQKQQGAKRNSIGPEVQSSQTGADTLDLVIDETSTVVSPTSKSTTEHSSDANTHHAPDVLPLPSQNWRLAKLPLGDYIRLVQIIADQLLTHDSPNKPSVIQSEKENFSAFMSEASAEESAAFETSLDASQINQINAPHIRARRGDSVMELLAPGAAFWDTFGLSPISGSKNVTAFCFAPSGEGLQRDVEIFLLRVGGAYVNARLGSHAPGQSQESDGGIISVQISEDSTESTAREKYLQEMIRLSISVGSHLAAKPKPAGNVVIYIVNPFDGDQGIQDMCIAFYSLLQSYMRPKAGVKSKFLSEVVLQIVPIDFIASPNGLRIPTQSSYSKLAFEVYDRCTVVQQDFDRNGPLYFAPRFVLSQPPPKSVDFRLAAQPSSFSTCEISHIHLAYSRSADDRWISASWTESWGRFQHNVSYCCGQAGQPPNRPVSEVLREMWETTVEIVRLRPAKWRVVVVKVGRLDADEPQEWIDFAVRPGAPPIGVTVLSTQGQSRVRPTHTLSRLQAESGGGITGISTPVSTPMANSQSPEQVSAAVTPGGGSANAPTPTDSALEQEPDTTLVEVTDESWSACLSGSLGSDDEKVLAKGWLIKRSGPQESDDLLTMDVSVHHAPQHNAIQLPEILAIYRGLATVARLRGVTDIAKSTLPWHVATALKAQEALSRSIRFDPQGSPTLLINRSFTNENHTNRTLTQRHEATAPRPSFKALQKSRNLDKAFEA